MRRMLLILVLMLPPCASAEINDSIFDVLGMEAFNGDWSNVTGSGAPEKKVHWDGHIKGWIDITGFENVAVIDSCEHVLGSPCDNAIIQYDAWHTFTHLWDLGLCFNDNVDHLLTNVRCFEDGDYVVAVLDVKLLWHSTSADGGKDYVTETMSISTRELSPNVFNDMIDMPTAIITFYNDSWSPVAFIDVEAPESVIKTTYTYNNISITEYNTVGLIHDSYVEFVNDSTIWEADPNQTIMTRRGDSAVVMDRNFTASNLTITLDTPYSQHNVTNITLHIVEQKKPRVGLLVKVLSVLGCSMTAIILVVGVVRRSF